MEYDISCLGWIRYDDKFFSKQPNFSLLARSEALFIIDDTIAVKALTSRGNPC